MRFNKSLLKTKLKASGIHLGLSLIIFFVLAYQIYYVWYPVPYFSVDGGWQGIRLIAAVDLVLGPFITFLIFDLRKSRRAIVFDLIVIALFQASALVYGVVTTYQQRPVAIVLVDPWLISNVADSYGSQLDSLTELKQYSSETPPVIFVDVEPTREALEKMLRIKTEDKIEEASQVHLYQPFPMLVKALASRQQGYLGLIQQWGAKDMLELWLVQNNKQQAEILIAPFNGRYGMVWLIFDQEAKYQDYLKP